LKGFNNNIQGGLDYFFSEKSYLTASYLFRRSDARRITDLTYRDYYNSLSNLIRTTYRQQDEKETEPNSEYALTYRRDFDKKNHSFSAEVRYIDGGSALTNYLLKMRLCQMVQLIKPKLCYKTP
jgi:DNA gyrase/topoisomerase IV subunit B